MNPRLEELTACLLDETLTDDEQRELAGLLADDPEARAGLRSGLLVGELVSQALDPARSAEAFMQDFSLRAGYADDEAFVAGTAARIRREQRPSRRAFPGLRWIRGWVAAAACILVVIGAAVLMRGSRPAELPLAMLGDLQGQVTVERDGTPAAPTADEPLFGCETVVTDGGSAGRITFRGEATSVAADSSTRVQVGLEQGAKRVYVEYGSVTCDVAPQPAGRPLTVVTPHATAEVRGTRFTVAVSAETGTHLAVTEGTVWFTPADAGQGIPVGRGEWAAADTAGSVTFSPENTPVTPDMPVFGPWQDVTRAAWEPDLGPGSMQVTDDGIYFPPRESELRTVLVVPFTQGEIRIRFRMTGPYWEFRIHDPDIELSYTDVGIDGRFRGDHELVIRIEGTHMVFFVDGKPGEEQPGTQADGTLSQPLAGRAQFRFHLLGRTDLLVRSIEYRLIKE